MPSRITRRYWCSQHVSIVCLDRDGWSHTVSGNLEEIDEGSAVVLAEAPVPIGKKVRVVCGGNQLNGSIAASVYDEVLGFFIEVQFDLDSQWSERRFKPRHLLMVIPAVPLRAAG